MPQAHRVRTNSAIEFVLLILLFLVPAAQSQSPYWSDQSVLSDNFRDVPDIVGDFFRSGGASSITFRPTAPLPPMATGTLVLDAANNRLVYIDGTSTLLVPGNPGIGSSLTLFQAPGGGLLTQTTNAQGLTGYFGLERRVVDPSSMVTTTGSPFDLLQQPGTVTVTDPVSGGMGPSPPYSAQLSLATQLASDPSLVNTGLARIAAGGSPVPRDRVFFHHSFFDNVPLANDGISVNRFTPGLEKLLTEEGDLSFEVRLPFAATLDHDFNVNGGASTDELEFGNISLALKQILAKNDHWLISGGLQVSLPTARDTSLLVTDLGQQREFLRIENESIHIMPFIGSVYAPNDRFFMQSFLQLDVDSNGQPVLANPNALNGGSLSQVGRLNSAAFLYADLSLGYWLKKESDQSLRTVTGFAPMVELHYLRNLSSTDSVNFAPLGSIGSGGDVETLTATVAGVIELKHQNQLTIGYSTPLAGGRDEPFDGELRVMFTHRFGAN